MVSFLPLPSLLTIGLRLSYLFQCSSHWFTQLSLDRHLDHGHSAFISSFSTLSLNKWITSILVLQYLSTLQSFDESTAVVGAGAHSLCPALPEQTGHRCLVSQTKATAILEAGKWKQVVWSTKSKTGHAGWCVCATDLFWMEDFCTLIIKKRILCFNWRGEKGGKASFEGWEITTPGIRKVNFDKSLLL